MKITKIVNKVTIGAKVKSNTYNNIAIIIRLSSTGRYELSNTMFMNKDGTITGRNDILLDTYRVIPYKRYIFKYKR